MVVGRRQELVQRLLYVLTYFIRCSELLETHLLDSAEDEAIVIPGSLITTSLRKGEVEESDYVLVTVHKPSGDYLSQGAEGPHTEAEDSSYRSGNSLQSSTYTDMEAEAEVEAEHDARDTPKEDEEDEEDEEDSSESQGSRSSVLQTHGQVADPVMRTEGAEEPGELHREASSPPAAEARLETVLNVGSVSARKPVCVPDTETESGLKLTVPPLVTTRVPDPHSATVSTEERHPGGEFGLGASPENQPSRVLAPRTLGIPLEKKPPDKSTAAAMSVPVTRPMALAQTEDEPATKVTFLIGDSMSPESDTESRRRRMEEEIEKHKKDQSKETKPAPTLLRVSSKMPRWSQTCVEGFAGYFSQDNPVETVEDLAKERELRTADCLHKDLLDPSGGPQLGGGHSRGKGIPLCLASEGRDAESSRMADSVFDVERRCRCGSTDFCDNCSAEQDNGLLLSVPVPQDGGSSHSKGNQKAKVVPINDWEIPRNESSDSALGDSETEDAEDWQEEMLVPFPG